jgi:hypothetical protein
MDTTKTNQALRDAIAILYNLNGGEHVRISGDNPIWVFMHHAQKHLEKQIFFAEEQAFAALIKDGKYDGKY